MKVKTKQQMEDILKIKEIKVGKIKENIRCYKNEEKNEFCSEKKDGAKAKVMKYQREEIQEQSEMNDIQDWIKLMTLMQDYGIIEWEFFEQEGQIVLMNTPMPTEVDCNFEQIKTEEEVDRKERIRRERKVNQLRTIDKLRLLEQGVRKQADTAKKEKENLETVLKCTNEDNEKREKDNLKLIEE